MIHFSLLTETRTFDFSAGYVSIGRDRRCTFVLPDSSVWPLHAAIFAENGRLFIEKSERAALTFVNRAPIPTSRIELFDRDMIDIGPWTLMIRSSDLPTREQRPPNRPVSETPRRFDRPAVSDDTSSSIIIL